MHLNEDFGTTLCDVVRNGRMDMAVLYGGEVGMQGLSFEPLLTEDMFLVAPAGTLHADDVALADISHIELLLPCAGNQLRQYLDRSFAAARITPRVVAEMESATTLAAAVRSGVGATILPVSAARAVAANAGVKVNRIVAPTIEVPLALCASDRQPLSEPALVVRSILLELVGDIELNVGLHTLQ